MQEKMKVIQQVVDGHDVLFIATSHFTGSARVTRNVIVPRKAKGFRQKLWFPIGDAVVLAIECDRQVVTVLPAVTRTGSPGDTSKAIQPAMPLDMPYVYTAGSNRKCQLGESTTELIFDNPGEDEATVRIVALLK